MTHRTILAIPRCGVQLGSHRSSALAARNLDFATIQFKRFKACECPFIDPAKFCDFSKMHAYFEKYFFAIEASRRSTMSLDFPKSLMESTPGEIKALLNTMVAQVGSNGRGGSMYVLSW